MPTTKKILWMRSNDFDATKKFYKAVFGWVPEEPSLCPIEFSHDDLTFRFLKQQVALARSSQPVTILCADVYKVRKGVISERGRITLQPCSCNDERLQFTDPDGNELAVKARFSEEQLKALKDSAYKHKVESVRWFNPGELVRTFWHKSMSEIIGAHADRRETQAGFANLYCNGKPSFHDYSSRSEFSFDFAADTGDGWDATEAVADLMLKEELTVRDCKIKLERPLVVVFGGDLVYPTANHDEYNRRMIAPFTHAAIKYGLGYQNHEDPVCESSPRVYAIPGNHDWYDGLSAFWALFCRTRIDPVTGKRLDGRWVGPWVARQQRSYFALRLPQNWWVWGVDIQLSGWIDQPQGNYFEDLAKEMGPDAKLIVCTAEPRWVQGEMDGANRFSQLGYVLRRALRHKIDVRAVLTGDLHHYSHYRGRLDPSPEDRLPKDEGYGGYCSFITAGGGGAFTHPTHQLPETINLVRNPKDPEKDLHPWSAQLREATLQRRYPESCASRLHSLWLLRFPYSNFGFVLLTGAIWMFIGLGIAAIPLSLVLGAGIAAFATLARERYKGGLWVLGCCHAAVQLYFGQRFSRWAAAAAVEHSTYLEWLAPALSCLANLMALILPLCTSNECEPWALLRSFAKGLAWFIYGGFTSAFLMGLYLLICTNLFGHHNEAFSAIRSDRWKNFLRIKIDKDGDATVYAIGLDKPGKDPELIQQFVLDKKSWRPGEE